jgi:hypothetical protein
LAAAAWNLLGAIHTEEMIERDLLPKELDNRPNYLSKKDPRPFIEKGQCNHNHPQFINTTCDLGYACDACPYNKDKK